MSKSPVDNFGDVKKDTTKKVSLKKTTVSTNEKLEEVQGNTFNPAMFPAAKPSGQSESFDILS